MWADESVVRYIGGKRSTEAEAWSRFLRYIGHWQVLGFGYWVVEDRATGRFLGEVGFADYKRGIHPSLTGLPEIGWVLAPHAQGCGIATETVRAAIAWGDKNLSGPSTYCIFDPEHAASIRIAAKTGYAKYTDAEYAGQPTLVMKRDRPD